MSSLTPTIISRSGLSTNQIGTLLGSPDIFGRRTRSANLIKAVQLAAVLAVVTMTVISIFRKSRIHRVQMISPDYFKQQRGHLFALFERKK